MAMAAETPTSFSFSTAEREELLRDPEAFAARAEDVLQKLVHKLRRQEADRAAEVIDSEHQYHQLERAHATLRDEHQRAIEQHSSMTQQLADVQQARDQLAADVGRMGAEARTREVSALPSPVHTHKPSRALLALGWGVPRASSHTPP